MKRIPPAFVVLATFLAVLLPFEQSHCAWMGLTTSAARAGAHACCKSAAKAVPASQAAADCSCMKLPAGPLPAPLVSSPMSAGVSGVVAAKISSFFPAEARGPALSLDIGSPPLLMKHGAHGLRAPPRTA